MRLQEIEVALERFKICPKCKATEGFWLGSKRESFYAQCKGCGSKFELFEIYPVTTGKEVPQRIKFLRR